MKNKIYAIKKGVNKLKLHLFNATYVRYRSTLYGSGHYSLLKLSTGLAIAALIVVNPIISADIKRVEIEAKIK